MEIHKNQTDTFLNMIRSIDLESFTVMARNLKVMLIALDQDLKLQYGNDVFFDMVGWPAKQVLDEDYVKNFIPPEFSFVVRNTLLEIINKHVDNYGGSNYVMTKNHGARYVNWNSVHLSSPDNKTRSMICIGIDITENTSLQDILQRTALEKTLIIDSIKEFIFYRDEAGNILEANQAFLDWGESRQQTAIGTHCYKLLYNLNRQCPNCPLPGVLAIGKSQTIYTTLPDGSSWEEKMHLLKADSIHTRQFMVVMTPLENDAKVSTTIEPENRKYSKNVSGSDKISVFSKPMQKVIDQAKLLHKDRTVPVLIEGETGTGKELIARFIHFGPNGTDRPFIDINCAAITPTIFESELFGYEGGAFTGGRAGGQKGKLDLAQGGSLFLDEIGEIPVSMQAKLLRVIQEKEYYRVGGLKKQEADVRLICATNVNLEKNIQEGIFRKDLFYRLEAVRIHIPPLRFRKDDILPLAQIFLESSALRKNKRFKKISSEAASSLVSYTWPGNVRQLKNTIEYIVIMYDDFEVQPNHLEFLPKHTTSTTERTNIEERVTMVINPNMELPEEKLDLQQLTNKILIEALAKHGGNKTATANYLNISRRSLIYRLQQINTN